MATTITFNGFDLNSGNYITNSLDKKSRLDTLTSSNSITDGVKNIAQDTRQIDFVLQGIIKGTSQSNCETNIDTFMQTFGDIYATASSANLDIAYAGGTRRYRCSVPEAPEVTRKEGQLSFANFTLNLTALDGFGTDTSDTTQSYTNETSASIKKTYTFLGTAKPLPTIRVSIDSLTAMSKMVVTNNTTNTAITIERTFGAGEEIDIIPERNLVTVDGTSVSWTGVMPEFLRGENTVTFDITSTAHQVDIDYIYKKRYI